MGVLKERKLTLYGSSMMFSEVKERQRQEPIHSRCNTFAINEFKPSLNADVRSEPVIFMKMFCEFDGLCID